MGNCASRHPKTKKKSTAELAPSSSTSDDIVKRFKPTATTSVTPPSPPRPRLPPQSSQPSPPPPPPPPPPQVVATLYGNPSSLLTNYLRFALHYKPLSLRFIPSDSSTFTFQHRDDKVTGSADTLLELVEKKFPNPPLLLARNLGRWECESSTPLVVMMAALQHRSMIWHIDRIVKWGTDLAARGGKTSVDPGVGTPKMEIRKFGKSYGELLEVLIEHGRMEDKVVFPILQLADRGICKKGTEEQSRDLPIMNGIKEDFKFIGVLNADTPDYREALYSLSARLETFKELCKEHFEEEESDVFPILEATELTADQQNRVMEQCVNVMEATHSHLFRFFMEGLLPQEAMQYLDLVMSIVDKQRMGAMLRHLVESDKDKFKDKLQRLIDAEGNV